MALHPALQLLHAADSVRLERILLQVQQAAHRVPLVHMALHPALQSLHAPHHVLLGIRALSAQLINMEELLQAALDLVVLYAHLECILLQAQQAAYRVMLVDMVLHAALQSLHAPQHVLLVIVALRVQLTNMEELLQAALVLVASYVLQELMHPLEQHLAHHVLLVNTALHPALHLLHVLEHVRLVIVALRVQLTNMEELLQAALDQVV